ncbi:VOC family protein [Nocardia cyriacigeorgica]|uniref:VOC family protein n=1 Tax=Nocardia cyriacigeorgica TaxID=135487 RepID=UPI002456505F|nr:VOC family protein [Nocardia cyriacigeorgica]
MTNRVVHFEIPFDDGDRARAFYRDAFDWQVNEVPDIDYTLVMTGPLGADGMSSEPGYINGGLTRRGEVTSPVLTIEVDDIEGALAKIGSLGGTTVAPKSAVGDMGFTAYFADPEGNLIGLWENAAQP